MRRPFLALLVALLGCTLLPGLGCVMRSSGPAHYDYFGKPVYVYSLKEGINDGFLTPFRVNQISTTIDEYVWTDDDEVDDGEVEEGKRYKESEFNVSIEIKEREAKRVQIFLDSVDQGEKAIVFCATQNHALMTRDLINQRANSEDPNYCARVKAGDTIARVHPVDHCGRLPDVYRAEIDGLFTGRHFPGLIGLGDFLALVAVPAD